MATEEARPKKTIGNVGTLDIRTASEATIAEIEKVGNVGMVLYSPETAPLFTRLNIDNMGMSVEASVDAQVINGQLEIDSDYLKSLDEPVELLVLGQLIIKPDVQAEEIEKGLDKLVVCGLVLCPEDLLGAVRAKLRDFEGQLLPYSESFKFVMGKVDLDETYLQGLDDGAELLIMGKVDVPQVLDDELLRRKIASLQVMGKISCREENLPTLRSLLKEMGGQVKISAVPAGFEPVDGHIALDGLALKNLPGRKLYCTGEVQITGEVDAVALDEALEALQVTGLLICPAALQEVVAQKCDVLKTRTVFYEGELWLVDDAMDLLASRFDFLEGKATLVVRDLLTIDPEIDPQMLAERLDKVHNFETIRCTPGQMGAVQARMGIDEGTLIDSTKKEEEEKEKEKEKEKKEENKIGNVGHLKL